MGVPALLAASSLLTASDFWQHAIHANAHIVTALLASVSIFTLLRWRATQNDRWLWLFGFVAGLSVTHHPLLVFGLPAGALADRYDRRKLLLGLQGANMAVAALLAAL